MIIKKIRNFFSYGFFLGLSFGFWLFVIPLPRSFKNLNSILSKILETIEDLIWAIEDLMYPILHAPQELFYDSIILITFALIFGIIGWMIQTVVRKYKMKLGRTVRQKTWKSNSIVASVAALSYLAAMTSYAEEGGWISLGFTYWYPKILVIYGIPSVIFIFILNYIIHKVKKPFKGVVVGFALSIPFFIITVNAWVSGHYDYAQLNIIRGVGIIIVVTIYAYYLKKKIKNDV